MGSYPHILTLSLPGYLGWEITDIARHTNGVGVLGILLRLNIFTLGALYPDIDFDNVKCTMSLFTSPGIDTRSPCIAITTKCCGITHFGITKKYNFCFRHLEMDCHSSVTLTR